LLAIWRTQVAQDRKNCRNILISSCNSSSNPSKIRCHISSTKKTAFRHWSTS
jgi:hypothetical protein